MPNHPCDRPADQSYVESAKLNLRRIRECHQGRLTPREEAKAICAMLETLKVYLLARAYLPADTPLGRGPLP